MECRSGNVRDDPRLESLQATVVVNRADDGRDRLRVEMKGGHMAPGAQWSGEEAGGEVDLHGDRIAG